MKKPLPVLGSQFPVGKHQAMPFRHYVQEISPAKTRLELSLASPRLIENRELETEN